MNDPSFVKCLRSATIKVTISVGLALISVFAPDMSGWSGQHPVQISRKQKKYVYRLKLQLCHLKVLLTKLTQEQTIRLIITLLSILNRSSFWHL